MFSQRRRRRTATLLALLVAAPLCLVFFCTLPVSSCSDAASSSSLPIVDRVLPLGSPPTLSKSRFPNPAAASYLDLDSSLSANCSSTTMVSISSLLCRPCIFCGIVDGDPADKLIYKDEYIAAFNDINPAAETHILIVPIKHIETVKTVKPEDLDVLKRMQAKGQELLAERGYDSSNSKLGFHVPPFNTVQHLHLHVLGGEYRNTFRRKKYESGRMWYMDMHQLLEKVEKMKKVQEGARL